jgi:hypothetical protein
MKSNALSPEEKARLAELEKQIENATEKQPKAVEAIIDMGRILEPYVKSYDEDYRDFPKSKREADFDQWARIRFGITGKQVKLCVKAYKKRMG